MSLLRRNVVTFNAIWQLCLTVMLLTKIEASKDIFQLTQRVEQKETTWS